MKINKFLVGLGIGDVVGMLIAPKKGSELREDIVNKSKELSEAKDLSKVESSMTSILEKNLDKINNCSTVKEIASTVKNILDKNNRVRSK